jgi:transglutaminase-like putative cysteine protease
MFLLSMRLIQVSGDLNDYLASSAVIDYGDEAVALKASRLSADAHNDTGKARAFFEFVRDDIRHTFDAGAEEVTCKASDVLKFGHGTCYAKSHLLAAMLRCSGIPAGFCYQRLADDDSPTGFVLHGLNAAFLKGPDKWVRLDARGNKPGVNVQFDIGSDMLAFGVDESLGESEDPRIFAEPADSVIKALTINRTAKALSRSLPDRD